MGLTPSREIRAGTGLGSEPMLLDHTDLFHVCHVVPDVEEAMAAFSARFELTWGPAEPLTVLAFVPGEEPAEQVGRTTFSRQGPVHIELGELVSGPVRLRSDLVEPSHCGYWCDDVETTTDGLISSGWTLEFEVSTQHGGPRVPFLRSPSGYGVELVSRANQALLEHRIAGRA